MFCLELCARADLFVLTGGGGLWSEWSPFSSNSSATGISTLAVAPFGLQPPTLMEVTEDSVSLNWTEPDNGTSNPGTARLALVSRVDKSVAVQVELQSYFIVSSSGMDSLGSQRSPQSPLRGSLHSPLSSLLWKR